MNLNEHKDILTLSTVNADCSQPLQINTLNLQKHTKDACKFTSWFSQKFTFQLSPLHIKHLPLAINQNYFGLY